jgi:transcriptional regulator GlxA family with amidase domain
MAEQQPKAREIVILLFDGVQSLDVTGPLEVFSAAGRVLDSRGHAPDGQAMAGYKITTLSSDGARLRTSSGLEIVPDGSFTDRPEQLDTLIVPGGRGSRAAGGGRAAARMGARDIGERAAYGVGLHGRVRARRSGPARRPARDDALVGGEAPRADAPEH